MERENQKFFNEFFCSKTRNSVPSLQHATMVNIAIDLWNHIDIKESIINYRLNSDSRSDWKEWREIEEKALAKVAQLPITKVLKKDFVSVISAIGLQIKNWWRYHQQETGLSILPNRFLWTSRGTIDRVKTAECLVKDEDIDVDTRYRLACMYCMEDVIPEAWEQLDEDQKHFYYRIDKAERQSHLKFKFMLTYWAYKLKGEASKLDSFNSVHSFAFHNAVYMGNKMAAKFFFSKMTDEEKDKFIVTHAEVVAMLHSRKPFCASTTPNEYYAEVFMFLLTRMSEVQKEEVFEKSPFKMLECLLEWPNRPLFVELAERTVHSNPDGVLNSIIKNMVNGCGDCTSRHLFFYFWDLTPLSYKERAIEQLDYCTLMKLYETNEVGIIRALFQHACAVEKEALIMCRRQRDITSCRLMKMKGWAPMEEAVVKFRTEFLGTQ